MGKDDLLTAPSSECSAMLQAAFKKLKIDPEWQEKSLSNSPDNQTLHRLWAGKSFRGKAKSVPEETCTHRCSADQPSSGHGATKQRVEPYTLDCIDTIQHLSFKSEQCTKANCGCKKSKGTKPSHRSGALSFISGSSPLRRKVIWEEKLRLRNSEKDRKQIIRSAKLKLYREGKGFQGQPFFPFGRILKKGRHCGSSPQSSKVRVFGSGASNSPDFQSVSVESPPCTQFLDSPSSRNMNNSGHFLPITSASTVLFSQPASRPTDPTDSTQQGVKRKSPCRLKSAPVGAKMERKHDKTCSLEARFSKEDFSVNELASYFEDSVYIPKKMSSMAEMMYT